MTAPHVLAASSPVNSWPGDSSPGTRYGPLDRVIVQVELYVPAKVAAGMCSVRPGVTVWLPTPVVLAASNSSVAAGAVEPAGTV